MSADCQLTDPVSKLLLDLNKIDLQNIKNSKPKIGQVIITPKGKYKTFSLIIKQKHFDEIDIADIKLALNNLAEYLLHYDIETIRISKCNNLLDSLEFSVYIDLLRETLGKCPCTLHICYGTTIIPPDDLRRQIIEECHDSTIGGHRGRTKTYLRAREKYYWTGMKEDITEYIRNCKSCQELKLVRIKNKEPMVIRIHPSNRFLKYQ